MSIKKCPIAKVLRDKHVEAELKILRAIFSKLSSRYLTPLGWNCSPEMCDVVLAIFAAIRALENAQGKVLIDKQLIKVIQFNAAKLTKKMLSRT